MSVTNPHAGMVLILAASLAACAAHRVSPNSPAAQAQASAAGAAGETLPLRDEPVVLEVARTPPADAEVVCSEESVTGTHQERVLCATRAERRERQREAQDWLRSGGFSGGVSRVPTVR